MKLYDCAAASSPRRVRIFAAEKNIALEKIAVDLASGEQLGADFREINPDFSQRRTRTAILLSG